MTAPDQGSALQLRSTVLEDGTLRLSLESVPIPEPQDDEVLVRVHATSPRGTTAVRAAGQSPSCVERVGNAALIAAGVAGRVLMIGSH